MTSEKPAQKFHTDDASLPRSGLCFWLVVPRIVGNLFQAIRGITQIWEVTLHQYGISVLVSQTSFHGQTRGGLATFRLFSEAMVMRKSYCRKSCTFINLVAWSKVVHFPPCVTIKYQIKSFVFWCSYRWSCFFARSHSSPVLSLVSFCRGQVVTSRYHGCKISGYQQTVVLQICQKKTKKKEMTWMPFLCTIALWTKR